MGFLILFLVIVILIASFYIYEYFKKQAKLKNAITYNLKIFNDQFDEGCIPWHSFTTYVAGIRHTNENGTDRQLIAESLTPGQTLLLLPEEGNRYDEHAIAVILENGLQLGYLPAKISAEIHNEIQNRRKVTAEVQDKFYKEDKIYVDLLLTKHVIHENINNPDTDTD